MALQDSLDFCDGLVNYMRGFARSYDMYCGFIAIIAVLNTIYAVLDEICLIPMLLSDLHG